jgi:hypothetical protein
MKIYHSTPLKTKLDDEPGNWLHGQALYDAHMSPSCTTRTSTAATKQYRKQSIEANGHQVEEPA